MILATHALTGAIIGKNIDSPWLIIIISLALHYILDTFRHGEYLDRKSTARETAWKVALDIGIGFLIILIFIYFKNIGATTIRNMIIGAFFSMFPDFLTLLFWKFRMKFLKPLFAFHQWVHRYPPFSPEREWNLRNAVNDIAISIIAIILLVA